MWQNRLFKIPPSKCNIFNISDSRTSISRVARLVIKLRGARILWVVIVQSSSNISDRFSASKTFASEVLP